MKNFGFVAVAFAAVLAGCDEPTPCDPATDTACEDTGETGSADPLLIDSFGYTCESDTSSGCGADCGSIWDYTIEVSGSNSGGVVIVDQATTSPWQETHDLVGTATTLTRHLVGGHLADQTANVSTLFQCGQDKMEPNMVWRYEVYPPEGGNVPADCVVASGSVAAPEDIWGADFGGCANGDNW